MKQRLQNQVLYIAANAIRKIGHNFKEEKDARVQSMRQTIDSLDNKAIQFKIEYYPDGSWSAESVNLDGIMTGGHNPQEIPHMIKDAIFTYFEVPPHLCLDNLLRSDNEPARASQIVHVGA